MFTAPTAIRAIRKVDPDGALLADHDLSSLRTLFLAGERLDPDTYAWAGDKLGVPVIDHWWQTETGWPIAANPRGLEPLPIKAGSPTVAGPRLRAGVLDGSGQSAPTGTDGAICVKLPLPPGSTGHDLGRRPALRRWLSLDLPGPLPERRRRLPGLGRVRVRDGPHRRRDQRRRPPAVDGLDGGGAGVASRSGGVCGDRGRRRAQGPASSRPRRGQGRRGHRSEGALAAELVALVRSEIGPVAALRQVDIVAALPKTRSGKILRKTMREIADGLPGVVPSTIEDPAVVEALRPVLRPG